MATMMRDSYTQEQDPNTINYSNAPQEYTPLSQPQQNLGAPVNILGPSIAAPISPGRLAPSVVHPGQSLVYSNAQPQIVTQATLGYQRPSQYNSIAYAE